MICWQFLGAGSRLTYGPYLYEQQNRQNYTVELLQFVNDNTYKLMIIWKYVTCISVYSVFSPSNSVSRILSLMVQLPGGARYVTVPLAFGGSKTLNDSNVTIKYFGPSKNHILIPKIIFDFQCRAVCKYLTLCFIIRFSCTVPQISPPVICVPTLRACIGAKSHSVTVFKAVVLIPCRE